jgi:alanyl-tRNA synthetase
LSQEQIKNLEDIVNAKIMENINLNIYETNYNYAVKKGVTAIFGEKYNPDCVRVIDITEFSAELCGGTHANRTGDIGVFKITESTALSAGNRRIVAVTGPKAIELFQTDFNITKQLAQNFKVQTQEVTQAVDKQTSELKKARHEITSLKKELLKLQIPQICLNKKAVQNISFIAHEFIDADSSLLQDAAEMLSKNINGLALTYSNKNEKSTFVLTYAPSLKISLDAIKIVLQDHGIKSGGKSNILQGGGAVINQNLIDNLIKALN